MREILFRGKDKRGYWHCGYYTTYIYANQYSAIQDENSVYTVIPETVGQFTNQKDVNGCKIFEGDIVSILNGESNEKGYVKFSDRGFWAFIPLHPEEFFDNPEYFDDISIDLYCFTEKSNDNGFCVVIGNIHDNPEMIDK